MEITLKKRKLHFSNTVPLSILRLDLLINISYVLSRKSDQGLKIDKGRKINLICFKKSVQ